LSGQHIDGEENRKSSGKDALASEQEFVRKISSVKRPSWRLSWLWQQIKEEVFPSAYSSASETIFGRAKCLLNFVEMGAGKKLAYRAIMNCSAHSATADRFRYRQ